MSFQRKKLSLLVPVLSVLGASAITPAYAQDEMEEEVVVTGFRQAVAAALDEKRNSANSMESIVAEDIGKMPDLNLAESLQRSPGVAITREGGEGRQITVRGLGPQYTRVTLNGMEVPSSAGGTDSSGGTNRGRPFDFNVFGSELFSKINIHKSATASVEEGGLASTVELFSHRPLDNTGLTLTGSAQSGFNLNTGEMAPRLSGLYSQTFWEDKIGVLAAINYSKREVRQDGFGTVRWTSPIDNRRSDSPLGWGWADNTATLNGTANPLGNYDQSFIDARYQDVADWNSQTAAERLADERWDLDATKADDVALANSTDVATLTDADFVTAPRLPRMDLFNRETERTGIALGFQIQPTDQLEFGLNILRSEFDQDTTSLNYFAQIRNTHNVITPTELTFDGSGRYLVGGKFENVAPRSESRLQNGSSEFTQIVADFKYDINDTMRVSGLIGNANATYTEDYFRSNFDVNNRSTFEYALTNGGNLAEMSYGFDIADFSNYKYTNTRLQRDDLERDYDTFKVDYEWDFDDNGSNLRAGVIMNGRTISSEFYRTDFSQDDGDGEIDADEVVITLTEANTNTVGSLYGDFADGIDAPAGFPTSWLVADFGQLYADMGSPKPQFLQTNSNTYEVTEDTSGLYGEVNWVYEQFLVNAGIRYVETDVTSGGYVISADGTPVFNELSGSYSNTLPSINVTYNILEDLRVRASWAENLARPNPASLSGAVTVSGLNGTISANNPALKPEKADSIDLAAEWFFAEESFVGLAIFQKEITDAISTESFENIAIPAEYRAIVEQHPDYNGADVANMEPLDSSTWTLNTKVNSADTTEINGWELGYQQVFEYGFGVLANYTSVDSGDDIIDGLSETTTNLGVFWENDIFSARLMMNSRDDYVTREPGRNGNVAEKTTGPERFDVSASWNVNEQFTVTAEIINLTDEKERIYVDGPRGNLDLVREYNTTGTEIFVGARYKF